MAKYKETKLTMCYVGSFANQTDAHRQIKYYIRSIGKEQVNLVSIRVIDIDFDTDPLEVIFKIPTKHLDAFDSYIKRGKLTVLEIEK